MSSLSTTFLIRIKPWRSNSSLWKPSFYTLQTQQMSTQIFQTERQSHLKFFFLVTGNFLQKAALYTHVKICFTCNVLHVRYALKCLLKHNWRAKLITGFTTGKIMLLNLKCLSLTGNVTLDNLLKLDPQCL